MFFLVTRKITVTTQECVVGKSCSCVIIYKLHRAIQLRRYLQELNWDITNSDCQLYWVQMLIS